jgi:26S proteasome regulatory subunit T1
MYASDFFPTGYTKGGGEEGRRGKIADKQGQGPYSIALKKIENELKEIQKRVDEKMGVRESDTGLAPPNLWDVAADAQRGGEKTLQVARCQTIIRASES